MSKKCRTICVSIAILWVAFAAGQTLYSGLRLIAPQKTSQSYQEFLFFSRSAGKTVCCNGREIALTFDEKASLDARLLHQLEKERSHGRHGLVVWGCLLVAGSLTLGLTWWGFRGSQLGAV